jgi:hypothetical protein
MACCAPNEWLVFLPQNSAFANVSTVICPLRAYAAQKTNLQLGLVADIRR